MIKSIEEGRKEDGNRSIADKIIKRLHDLEMTVENNHGRWAWELLQNAKDSVADSDTRKVSVEIELNKNSVVFRHNGKHFTEKDVRGLINQISSKEIEEGEEKKKTGKFGTGFLTTHLLSKVIQVDSIVETRDKEFFRFSFPLDRNGATTTQLIPKIEIAWTEFHKSTEGNQIETFDEFEFNTSFTYNLDTKKQQEIARVGVDEFSELIPFVLAFIPTIDTVTITDEIKKTKTKFENNDEITDGVILNILKTKNEKKSKIQLLFQKVDDIAIAGLIEETENGYQINNLKKFPKIFCDFPLIGTDDFHFPVIVNSFYFNPLMEREGIWLNKGEDKKEVEENKNILEQAVRLYEQLLTKITEQNFYDYTNICNTKTPSTRRETFDNDWYEEKIQNPLREIISKSKVIETENDKVLFSDVRFPDPKLKKEERENIWQFSTDLKVNTLPAKRHIHQWAELIWDECDLLDIDDLIKDLSDRKKLSDLSTTLDEDESETIIWLNDCIDFIYKIGEQVKFNEIALIPNQEGIFQQRKALATDEINDENLKEIANLLGYNYYKDLIHKDIAFQDSHRTTTKADVANKITNLFNDKDKDRNYLMAEDDKTAIRKLTKWFEENKKEGIELFETLYRKKEKLFVDTIEDKESLYKVLTSKTSLAKLAEIATAIKNDPELLKKIEELIREKLDLAHLKIVGEYFEVVLIEALKQYGFKVEKVIVGKDLIIHLKKSKIKYSIEVKSTKTREFVAMTSAQGKEASSHSDNYALCVIYNDGTKPTVDYIRKNAKLILDIGEKLTDKVSKVIEVENRHYEIITTTSTDDIVPTCENGLDYKYQISNKIWDNGKTFADFVKHISKL